MVQIIQPVGQGKILNHAETKMTHKSILCKFYASVRASTAYASNSENILKNKEEWCDSIALYNLQPFAYVQHIMQPNKSSIFHPLPSDISEVPIQADHLGTHTTFNTQAM